tara:strand:+ start:308 stop:955 length:648 start_codon:yes stop_codon:yes gene_type:complete
MIFIETDSLKLCVPSKKNLEVWTSWINSSFLRKTVPSTHFPKTIDMQWNWIQSELNSKKRMILEICDKSNDNFLGIVSLSQIDYQLKRSAQIATISPDIKTPKNRFCVYEARKALLEYSFNELSLNKIWGTMIYPENKSFMINNMCIGFEIEGINHDHSWQNNKPKLGINYFITRNIFEKKKLLEKKIDELLKKKDRINNEKKLNKIISSLHIKN